MASIPPSPCAGTVISRFASAGCTTPLPVGRIAHSFDRNPCKLKAPTGPAGSDVPGCTVAGRETDGEDTLETGESEAVPRAEVPFTGLPAAPLTDTGFALEAS